MRRIILCCFLLLATLLSSGDSRVTGKMSSDKTTWQRSIIRHHYNAHVVSLAELLSDVNLVIFPVISIYWLFSLGSVDSMEWLDDVFRAWLWVRKEDSDPEQNSSLKPSQGGGCSRHHSEVCQWSHRVEESRARCGSSGMTYYCVVFIFIQHLDLGVKTSFNKDSVRGRWDQRNTKVDIIKQSVVQTRDNASHYRPHL